MTFTDTEARDAWNAGAEAWDEFVESGADCYRHELHGPALLSACGPVDGMRVLDLGCGQGYFARQLASRGAVVSACDLSGALVALAARHEQRSPLGIRYACLSAADVGEHWPSGSFDLVTACMSLQDMADVPAALHAASRLLRPGGRLVASVPHPATDPPVREWERDDKGRKLALRLDRYFDTGPALCQWNMSRLRYHWSTPCRRHTLGEWTGLAADAGFVIGRLLEPRPTAAQVVARPELEDCHRMPYFLILDLWPHPAAGGATTRQAR
jgi:2-polyprenyl-3-methyl-5-hydroxy-6-metoxy-1,4-benzoquinol methylase